MNIREGGREKGKHGKGGNGKRVHGKGGREKGNLIYIYINMYPFLNDSNCSLQVTRF